MSSYKYPDKTKRVNSKRKGSRINYHEPRAVYDYMGQKVRKGFQKIFSKKGPCRRYIG